MTKSQFVCNYLILLPVSWIAIAIVAGTNFDRTTNPHQHPTDFAQEIHIQWIRILAGSVTSVTLMLTNQAFLTKQNTKNNTKA